MPSEHFAMYRAYLERRPAPDAGIEYLLDQLIHLFIAANSEKGVSSKPLDFAVWLKPVEIPKEKSEKLRNLFHQIEGRKRKKRVKINKPKQGAEHG